MHFRFRHVEHELPLSQALTSDRTHYLGGGLRHHAVALTLGTNRKTGEVEGFTVFSAIVYY